MKMFTEVETNVVSIERIQEYTEIQNEAPWLVEPGPPPDWPQEGRIEFEDYCTRYREGLDLVLDKLWMSLQPREKLGICGRTGVLSLLELSYLMSYDFTNFLLRQNRT